MAVRYSSEFDNKCVATFGVPSLIVLNFGIRNNLLFKPTRSDQKSTGPSEESFVATAIASIGGDRIISEIIDTEKSNIRLIIVSIFDKK